ncbi:MULTISPECIES: hypothetical protein [unclassified Novosphingobium]|uniref:hypothetical protein n=1 Tax=unclassified Novosphingobium TaxID=2644732 RepID=UPI000D2F5E69|nr:MULTISPECIES: hypothetical protein [unclassified Novosphingobium]PTR05376.1 hypothetical protein C8K11_1343 [Novosphingobium sp. GV055]PUA93940.1 hypothetical protein C8K12_1343 [Novosphingobium sp. GV061]PUB11357.1 hypothetical protein C8K14_1343 [Novosphingobium sp. GV079]PUB37047.1 hypothetical protein C8K10_1343 [Novosphingobium sp. GV027]
MAGEVAILNVGAGDTKLSFDPSNPAEVARAAKIVKDMIRRGFALLIEVGRDDKGPLYRRAHDFDATTNEYIVAGTPGEIEEPSHEQEPASAPRKGRKAAPRQRIPAATTNAVTVARTAGG